jgi:death on curing protein
VTSWIWVDQKVVFALHDEQIFEHGGQSGIRDQGLLDSALARPLNRANYDEASVSALAASYGFGIAKNHPFLDGNKRTALVVTELFLMLNGYILNADDASSLVTFLALADGSLTEEALSEWVNQNIIPADE